MTTPPQPPPRGSLSPEAYGTALRELAYEAAEDAALVDHGLTVEWSEITDKTLEIWNGKCRPKYTPGEPGAHWNWVAEVVKLRANPYRLEGALWTPDDTLCGLVVGALSKNRKVLNVALLARCPGAGNPLKAYVLILIDALAEAYAKAWDCSSLRIKQPLKEIYHLYVGLKYTLVKEGPSGPYFEREVAHDRD